MRALHSRKMTQISYFFHIRKQTFKKKRGLCHLLTFQISPEMFPAVTRVVVMETALRELCYVNLVACSAWRNKTSLNL